MIDAHIHIGRENSAKSTRSYQELFQEYLSRGITGVRDGGDGELAGVDARRAAEEVGILFKTPLYAFAKKSGYGDFLGRLLDGVDEIKDEFRRLLTFRPDFMKVICSGLVSFDEFGGMTQGGFTLPELEYAVGLAHDKGLRVMAHCSGAANIETALAAGVDSIEHGYFVTEEQLHQMREQGVYWIPTFAPFSNYMRRAKATPRQKEVLERTLTLHGRRLIAALAIGVKVAVGSDAGAMFVPHGQALLDEINCFVCAGVPREQALAMCKDNGRALLEA